MVYNKKYSYNNIITETFKKINEFLAKAENF